MKTRPSLLRRTQQPETIARVEMTAEASVRTRVGARARQGGR